MYAKIPNTRDYFLYNNSKILNYEIRIITAQRVRNYDIFYHMYKQVVVLIHSTNLKCFGLQTKLEARTVRTLHTQTSTVTPRSLFSNPL